MSLFDQVSKDIIAAMKARDKVRLGALRNVKKFFIEARTAPGSNDELTDATALKIIQKLIKQGKDSAQIYTEQNRKDLADEELAQVEAIETYLPKQLTADELTAEVKAIIVEMGAIGPKDMGKVIGTATKKLAGKAEGKAISAIAKELLA
jgi:uncharacterized protein